MTETDPTLLAVGTRISYASNLGTIRYVGEVEGTRGIWLGVEWDDPRRGKHSGSRDGKSYFTCIVPNSATFLRLSSLVDFGQSFLRALSSKYVELPLETTTEKVMLGSSNGVIEVEAVGMNKVRSKLSRLESLREVSLDMENVSYADAPGEIRNKCPNIRSLDLSRSLVSSWEIIARIVCELPSLETLALNFNRFQLSSQGAIGGSFTRIRDLRLNGTLTSWETMLALLPSFPDLLRLEMGLNYLTALATSMASTVSTKLISLNLEGNKLQNWENIMESLVGFSQLNRLILSNNMIAGISTPFSKSKPQIRHLVLTSNNIQIWSDLNSLCEWFPELQTLNINRNPIGGETLSRPLIIARHPNLMTLNGSTISSAERRDSELFYLSFIAKNGPKSRTDREREFPRYREICDEYGEVEEIRDVQAETMRNRLIKIHFFQLPSSPSTTAVLDLPAHTFILHILPSMILRHLRSKILKTTSASPKASLQLWLILERGALREFAEIDTGTDSRPIEWWGVENGCKIAFLIT